MSMSTAERALADNALLDAMERADELDRDFTIDDLADRRLDLRIAADHYCRTYSGDNNFVKQLRTRLERTNKLTDPQRAVALTILRERMRGVTNKTGTKVTEYPSVFERYTCSDCEGSQDPFTCDAWPQLRSHKEQVHGYKAWAPTVDEVGTEEEGVSVISVTDDTGIDISGLQDGRYAVPNKNKTSTDDDYLFFFVRRQHNSKERDRAFVYGKVRKGREIVPAGTVEVKRLIGDTREIIGEQRPGGTYRGDFGPELELIMTAPEAFAKVFGLMREHCSICGAGLTSDWKYVGVGPECVKKEKYFEDPPPDWAAMEAARVVAEGDPEDDGDTPDGDDQDGDPDPGALVMLDQMAAWRGRRDPVNRPSEDVR